MSEEKTEVLVEEKSAEQLLAEHVEKQVSTYAETVAEKADKADLEGFVKAEQVEGFAKAEQIEEIQKNFDETLESIKNELGELEAKMSAAPAVHVKKESKMSYDFETKSENIAELVFKAVNATNSVTGVPVGAAQPTADLVAGNPFRGAATVIPVQSSSFKLPKLTSVVVGKNEDAGSVTEGAGVSSSTIVVDNYAGLARIAMPVIEDIPGLDALVGTDMVAKAAKAEADAIFATLKADTNITSVNGGDDALPTTLDAYENLMAAVGSQYWQNSAWFVSPEAWVSIRGIPQQGTGSPLAIDPALGGFTLFGRPVNVVASMDDGADSDDVPVIFGDAQRGLIIGSRSEFSITRSMENSMGHVTYYGDMRSGHGVREAAALAKLTTV